MIKIKTGYREDQYYSIPDKEAHKAYYLFLNPEKRGVFSNGLALLGVDIRGIEPDYQGTMGWNKSHELDSDDWNEIRGKKVDVKLKEIMQQAKLVCQMSNPPINLPLYEAIKLIEKKETSNLTEGLANKFKIQ